MGLVRLDWTILIDTTEMELTMTLKPPDVKLKKCPFCGGEAIMRYHSEDFWVACLECKASSRMSNYETDCIKYWNTRSKENL